MLDTARLKALGGGDAEMIQFAKLVLGSYWTIRHSLTEAA